MLTNRPVRQRANAGAGDPGLSAQQHEKLDDDTARGFSLGDRGQARGHQCVAEASPADCLGNKNRN